MTFLSPNNCLEARVSVVVLCINRCSQQTSARFFTTPACGLRLKGPLIADKGVSASFSEISPQFGIGIKASHRMAFGWSRARLRPRFHHLWRYERDAGTASVDKRHKSRSLKGTFFSLVEQRKQPWNGRGHGENAHDKFFTVCLASLTLLWNRMRIKRRESGNGFVPSLLANERAHNVSLRTRLVRWFNYHVLTLKHRHHISARETVEEWFNRGCVSAIEEANLNWTNGI